MELICGLLTIYLFVKLIKLTAKFAFWAIKVMIALSINLFLWPIRFLISFI